MLKIHVLDVGLGDSIVLETIVNSQSHYSIIDCKSIDSKAPTVEFLQQRGVTRIQSFFLTHLHRDHYSGLPQLLEYLQAAEGTLEYFVSAQIPDEVEIWRKILQVAHEKPTSAQLTAILRAMKGLQELPSATHMNKRVMPVRLAYEGAKDEGAWQGQLHPSLFFAPVNPTDQEAFRLVISAFEKASLHNRGINAISHAFLLRYDAGPRRHIGLFTGDMEGKSWRYVKNRCLEITAKAIRSELTFIKVPHHGAYNYGMETCLSQLINKNCGFAASISSPPGDSKHPDRRTLDFFEKTFDNCCIACTNISTPCHDQGFPFKAHGLFEQSAKEAEFLEIASSPRFEAVDVRKHGACAGSHTISIADGDYTLTRSTGLPCSFNPSGCRKEFSNTAGTSDEIVKREHVCAREEQLHQP